MTAQYRVACVSSCKRYHGSQNNHHIATDPHAWSTFVVPIKLLLPSRFNIGVFAMLQSLSRAARNRHLPNLDEH